MLFADCKSAIINRRIANPTEQGKTVFRQIANPPKHITASMICNRT